MKRLLKLITGEPKKVKHEIAMLEMPSMEHPKTMDDVIRNIDRIIEIERKLRIMRADRLGRN